MGEGRRLSEKSARVLGLIATGHSYEQIVHGEGDITYRDIFLAAEEALELNHPPDRGARIARIKAEYPNAYERWTPEDDAALADIHRSGATVSAMADYFGRQPSAIRSRLIKLQLESAYSGKTALTKAVYPNAYERWTLETDSLLAEMHESGASMLEMIECFQRQESAIRSRLAKLGLESG